jgi:hypothetical protein
MLSFAAQWRTRCSSFSVLDGCDRLFLPIGAITDRVANMLLSDQAVERWAF